MAAGRSAPRRPGTQLRAGRLRHPPVTFRVVAQRPTRSPVEREHGGSNPPDPTPTHVGHRPHPSARRADRRGWFDGRASTDCAPRDIARPAGQSGRHAEGHGGSTPPVRLSRPHGFGRVWQSRPLPVRAARHHPVSTPRDLLWSVGRAERAAFCRLRFTWHGSSTRESATLKLWWSRFESSPCHSAALLAPTPTGTHPTRPPSILDTPPCRHQTPHGS